MEAIMELASGSGRVAIPLARLAAASQLEMVGLERDGPMLEEARRKRAMLAEAERQYLSFVAADMREWHGAEPFDLVIALRGLCNAIAAQRQPSIDRRRRQAVVTTMAEQDLPPDRR